RLLGGCRRRRGGLAVVERHLASLAVIRLGADNRRARRIDRRRFGGWRGCRGWWRLDSLWCVRRFWRIRRLGRLDDLRRFGGLADDASFAAVDPGGFLVAEFSGEPAATISCVNYSDSFAFLGFYIVRPDLRGRGYGLRIWNEAIAHASRRVIGLDGVVAQQGNYRKSGFAYAYANIRYGGVVS